jgi:hypothetical protein
MPTLNPGQTNLVRGTFSADCTLETDLIRNQQKFPAIRQMLERVDQRQLTTLLTSGAVGPYGIDITKPTKFGKIKEGQAIGDTALRFNVMGRIQRPSTILAQQGSTAADGTFQLIMKDNLIYKGAMVVFNGNRFSALCMAEPAKIAAGWLYTFQHPQKEIFVFATHVALQANGTYTCFASTTGYGEKSLKGYGRDFFPDTYIVDMTTQRKTVAISGDAAADVLWYEYMASNGPVKGWKFEKVRQAEAQWAMENEYAKIFGISSMKNADGTRANQSNLVDFETGNQIIMGDGIEEQISGGNELFGSGVNGEATEDDFIDAMKLLTKQSSTSTTGVNIVFMTGIDGYYNAQRKMARFIAAQNAQLLQSVAGGDDIEVGYHIMKLNFAGSSVCFVQHPLFDDEARFTERGSDGQLIMSSTYIGGDLGSFMDSNIEIMAKGANGVNRSNVQTTINGMTGLPGDAISEEDAWRMAMLKQDLLVIYNTKKWAIIRKGM